MSGCPYCGWIADLSAAPWCAYPVDSWLPVVWDGERLRVARGSEMPGGWPPAYGVHIAEEHWLEPEVIALGPLTFGFENSPPVGLGNYSVTR